MVLSPDRFSGTFLHFALIGVQGEEHNRFDETSPILKNRFVCISRVLKTIKVAFRYFLYFALLIHPNCTGAFIENKVKKPYCFLFLLIEGDGTKNTVAILRSATVAGVIRLKNSLPSQEKRGIKIGPEPCNIYLAMPPSVDTFFEFAASFSAAIFLASAFALA